MSGFDTAIDRVLKNEGGYVNNAADPGGETNWGITVATARANNYFGPMRDMPRETAVEIYRTAFWQLVRADQMHPIVGYQAMDFAVNSGIGTAIRYLQRAAGAADDGVWGPVTKAKVAVANPAALGIRFLSLRLDFMRSLAAWKSFSSGWAGRIAEDMRYLADDLAGGVS